MPPTEIPEHLPVHLRYALSQGLIASAHVFEAEQVQLAAQKAGLTKTLDDVLLKKGYVSAQQLAEWKKAAASQQKAILPRFGDYEILKKLGAGSMGVVYLARQVPMDRTVALKVLRIDTKTTQDKLERFKREARAVAKLDHPHIVVGYDIGNVGKTHFFAMEYVDGQPLHKILRNEGIPSEHMALEWCRQVALALDHAHQRNILHRDVKPDNILITRDGQAKLMDLGLAKAMGDLNKEQLTKSGIAVGTPNYISPEQAMAKKDIGPATDLYSLGATMYELLTGKVVFTADHFPAIMHMHVTKPPMHPRDANPDVSIEANLVCLKLLEKKPEDRYLSGQALANDLQAIITGTYNLEKRDSTRLLSKKTTRRLRRRTRFE